jgi:hypothetical protein
VSRRRPAGARGALAGLAVLLSLTGLTGCKTTIDNTVSESSGPATTTTLPSGSVDELLPRLVIEAGKLSDLIGSRGDRGAQMRVINSLYDVVRPQIAAIDGVVALDFDGAIELCRKGEKFNRPADADKCFRNLTALIDSFLRA